MAKKKSTPRKTSGSAWRSQPIEAMECRQLLSASFEHALYPAFSRPAPAPATTIAPADHSGSFSSWHHGGENFNSDVAPSNPFTPSMQGGFDHSNEGPGGDGSYEFGSNSGQNFSPMHQDLLRASGSQDGLMPSGDSSVGATTIVWTISIPGDGNGIIFQDASNPLSGSVIVYERATYIITYGTMQPPTGVPMEMHGGQYDRDMPGKAQYPAQDGPVGAPVPAAPSGSDTTAAPAVPPASVGRVQPHLIHANNGGSAETVAAAPSTPVVAAAQSVSRPVEVAAIKPVNAASGVLNSAGVVTAAAMRTVAQELFAFAQAAPAVSGVVGDALALTGAGAATTPPMAIVAGSEAAAPQMSAIVQAASAVQAALHVNPIDAMSLFSDSMGSFINESVAMEPTAAIEHSHRAWAITAGVVTFDAILVGHWYMQRARQKKQSEEASPFRDGKPLLTDFSLVE